MNKIQRCTRCVMDDRSDLFIHFDEKGVCNYCKEALSLQPSWYFPNEEGKQKLEQMISALKKEGQGKIRLFDGAVWWIG